MNPVASRILITGASGLIGGRLIAHLLPSARKGIRAASRVPRTWPPGVEGCVIDAARPETLADACRGMDAVVNLASMGEKPCAADPQTALRANGAGGLALVQAAAAAGVTRFVHVSTLKVYGNNPTGRLTEQSLPSPQSHYGITHRLVEDYAMSQHANSVVFRLANGFGEPVGKPPGAWDVIGNEMCRQAVLDRQITIRSSGLAWRNFVPIADIVSALEAATDRLPAGLYHLGSRQSMPLRGLADRIAQVCAETLGYRPLVTTGPVGAGEAPAALDFCVDKLAATVAWSEQTFDEELRRTIRAAG